MVPHIRADYHGQLGSRKRQQMDCSDRRRVRQGVPDWEASAERRFFRICQRGASRQWPGLVAAIPDFVLVSQVALLEVTRMNASEVPVHGADSPPADELLPASFILRDFPDRPRDNREGGTSWSRRGLSLAPSHNPTPRCRCRIQDCWSFLRFSAQTEGS